jgi:hypothetical protein
LSTRKVFYFLSAHAKISILSIFSLNNLLRVSVRMLRREVVVVLTKA